jgi:hypothetical protein
MKARPNIPGFLLPNANFKDFNNYFITGTESTPFLKGIPMPG